MLNIWVLFGKCKMSVELYEVEDKKVAYYLDDGGGVWMWILGPRISVIPTALKEPSILATCSLTIDLSYLFLNAKYSTLVCIVYHFLLTLDISFILHLYVS
jgi:hypothetical protein